MALASTDLILTIPLASFVLYSNVSITGLSPCISWADTHSNFSRMMQVPGIYWRADPWGAASVETLRWVTVACALLFFAYFGFADETIKNYRGAFNSVAKRMGYTTAGSGMGDGVNWGDAHALSLVDVGGMLPDYKVSDYSSSPSSSSSASSSASSDTESVGEEEEGEIEVSSLHCASVHIPSLLEPAHMRRSSAADVPMLVVDAADLVCSVLSLPPSAFHLPPTFPNTHTDPDPTRTPSYASENSLIYRYTTMTLPTYQLYP
ncbi:hypothetical protein B0H13DRAFT_2379061 [Mycena leptocephala]|nr:hypothetical protein B0H13DRAFT_2379061 [Mycena leptocephala]